MNLELNPEPAEVMHVDLNSAFAMAEQQADPLLRGRPVGVLNRADERSMCIAASYEAKRLGIGLGTRGFEAKRKAADFVMMESDPAKYAHVHGKLKAILADYSPVSYMKSVDEGIVDMRGMRGVLKGRSLEDVGREIKQRVREEVGDYMTVNVGIGQNRWLAKVAAGFLKPDGLYKIDRDNLELVFGMLRLMDFPYIKARNRLRLNMAGVHTPLELLRAPEVMLMRQVFRSIEGRVWYLKLRGYETEQEFGVRTAGRSYVLEHRTADPEELALLLHKSALKVARRLRVHGLAARGLMLGLRYVREESERSLGWRSGGWCERRMYGAAARRGDQLYERALDLFRRSPQGRKVSALYMTAYAVEPVRTDQPELFADAWERRERVETALNMINDKYGELVLQPAAAAKSRNPMKDKVPFGSVRYLERCN
jgi:DNA polymerase-4